MLQQSLSEDKKCRLSIGPILILGLDQYVLIIPMYLTHGTLVVSVF